MSVKNINFNTYLKTREKNDKNLNGYMQLDNYTKLEIKLSTIF